MCDNRYQEALYAVLTERHFRAEGGCASSNKNPNKTCIVRIFFFKKALEIKHFRCYAFIVGFSHSRLLSKLNFFLEEVEVSLKTDMFSLGIRFLHSYCPGAKKTPKLSVKIKRNWMLLTKKRVLIYTLKKVRDIKDHV